MYELALSQSEQASQLPILNLFEFCLDIGEHFTEQIKLATLLSHSPRLRLTYELKEKFRDIFERHQSVEAGKAQLLDWLKEARPVYSDVLETIGNHLDGICNYFLNRTTSGVMEGINNRIKLIKRQGYGFVNFDNFRARLLACFSD